MWLELGGPTQSTPSTVARISRIPENAASPAWVPKLSP